MRPIRRSTVALLAAAALAAAGCGGDEEDEQTPAAEPPATTATTPTREDELGTAEAEIETETETEREEERSSPEEQEGGAGDEEAIRSEAMFIGRGGRIRPRAVRVPPFIAIRVTLQAPDGGDYTLRIGGKALKPGESATLPGLRPGRTYRGSGVVIAATAEPGP